MKQIKSLGSSFGINPMKPIEHDKPLKMSTNEVNQFNLDLEAIDGKSIWQLTKTIKGISNDTNNEVLTINSVIEEVNYLLEDLGSDNYNSKSVDSLMSCIKIAGMYKSLAMFKLIGLTWVKKGCK